MNKQRKGYSAGVAVKLQKNTEKKQFVLQYRGNISNEIVKKAEQNLSCTDNFRSCLSSFKSSFFKDLKYYVVYDLTGNGCKSIYVEQTC